MNTVEKVQLPKLRPDIKERWLEALRSGKYEQGKGMLRTGRWDEEYEEFVYDDEARFCCLGVLCDVIKNDDDVRGVWGPNGFEVTFVSTGDADTDLPPWDLAHIISERTEDEISPEDWNWNPIAARNDGTVYENKLFERHSFEDLAKIIEANC